ncbi:MAG: nucleotidyltransferase family protein [Gemmatimonadota bacterium]
MDAMIFAAGFGTRLRPLTDDRPKALVEVDGVPMLERVARRLVDAGADRLIINTHPFPGMIRELVEARHGFGAEVHFSHEPDAPLDTGGGLRQAVPLFRRDAPFFLHNCDVVSDIDLRALYTAHARDTDAAATLAVLPPSSDRYLVFDDVGLCGFSPRDGGEEVHARPAVGTAHRHDFSGIHVASPALLDTLPQTSIFSIITHYLTLAERGTRVARYEQPGAHWIDIGTHAKLAAARVLTSSRP